ncbi:hypothetical protein Tco_0683344 [Tanacetum coccineum]|uniref:Uncharacterized protein n=1 Tax=Tanacetum coccineum TaxID=301880 RepID=A0ABQ4XTQ1_9ASTR
MEPVVPDHLPPEEVVYQFPIRTMEELCQPSLDGRGGPIAPIAIQATTFGATEKRVTGDYTTHTLVAKSPVESK